MKSIAYIGWAVNTGNGGMGRDLVNNIPSVVRWIVPTHFDKNNNSTYFSSIRAGIEVIHVDHKMSEIDFKVLLSGIKKVIFIEYPPIQIFNSNLTDVCVQCGVKVVCIPMWEWWPQNPQWTKNVDIILCITNFTYKFIKGRVIHDEVRNIENRWKGNIFRVDWGVDLNEFKFIEKNNKNIAFINGNGGYENRKNLPLVLELAKSNPDMRIEIYTQKQITDVDIPDNCSVNCKDNDFRAEVYKRESIFLFPSKWEGFCHGIYEAQAVGGYVVCTNCPPINEVESNHLIQCGDYSFTEVGRWINAAQVTVENLTLAVNNVSQKISFFDGIKSNRLYIEKYFDLSANAMKIHKLLEVL